MPIKCSDIIKKLEQLAPKHLAEDWDNVGLLLGSPNQVIHKIMVTLDVDQEVVSESIAAGADLIIAHHPMIFKGITNIRTDSPYGSMISSLIKADIAVYAAHTNLDSAPGGVNDVLAQKFNLKDVKPLTTVYQEQLHKLIVFVPGTHVEQVRSAMTEAGAGHIGNYSHCTFLTQGTGTFLPLPNTKPFIGEQGKMEYVDECRLETVLPARLRSSIISAMLAAHPYEEVAYDEYLLLNEGSAYGLGRVGHLSSPLCLDDFISQVKIALNINSLKVAATVNTLIRRAAVCGGSGAGLIKNAIQAGADVLVTGDVKYHEAQQAVAEGLAIVDAGHFATEQPVVECIADYLNHCSAKNSWNVPIITRNITKDIFTTY
ncbi:Nif3-like dinuclear metal center hexameric protein [Sporomusa malonica]|uniref:GTP cyclohydrolase 1 type 2 homolog n=1 Tax=Sporomusa malonica TaxID=112901 RepID=A0A1W2D9T3_9FIRM|nr:Nif3-like dinuclear metal center hexameric protein [Sporomusa malonica]SMC94211.1 dinuclear metal center protein, YbgI/SA1388 family [Sporomusa malonica]